MLWQDIMNVTNTGCHTVVIGTVVDAVHKSCLRLNIHVQGADKKYHVKVFGTISPTTGNFNIKFYAATVYSCIRKITNFYSIIFNFDKNAISLQQYDLQVSPQNLARWCRTRLLSTSPVKLILTIQDGEQPIRLRDPFCIIMKYCKFSIFKMAHVGISKLKF